LGGEREGQKSYCGEARHSEPVEHLKLKNG
jgi:hypothetical protein